MGKLGSAGCFSFGVSEAVAVRYWLGLDLSEGSIGMDVYDDLFTHISGSSPGLAGHFFFHVPSPHG